MGVNRRVSAAVWDVEYISAFIGLLLNTGKSLGGVETPRVLRSHSDG